MIQRLILNFAIGRYGPKLASWASGLVLKLALYGLIRIEGVHLPPEMAAGYDAQGTADWAAKPVVRLERAVKA